MSGDVQPSQRTSQIPPMAIGSDVWPGLAKLAEECGELMQVIGKIAAYPGGDHPDGAGSLLGRLQDELADLNAAIDYTLIANTDLDKDAVIERSVAKRRRFL